MKALISPDQVIAYGCRVAQLAEVPFEVAPPLYWVDCPDDIHESEYFYSPGTDSFVLIPPPPIEERVATEPQPVVKGAQDL